MGWKVCILTNSSAFKHILNKDDDKSKCESELDAYSPIDTKKCFKCWAMELKNFVKLLVDNS